MTGSGTMPAKDYASTGFSTLADINTATVKMQRSRHSKPRNW